MDSKSHFMNGIEKTKEKNFLGAVDDFTKAINAETNPSFNMAEIYFRRAVANFHLRNSQEVAEDLLRAAELDPKYNNQGLFWNEF